MQLLSSVCRRSSRHHGLTHALRTRPNPRQLVTLAIETSCDDTSVAILERHDEGQTRQGASATLYFHEKVTASNEANRGIDPIVALDSHHANIAPLVSQALRHLPERKLSAHSANTGLLEVDGTQRCKPDFISVTRGPGMRSNLAVGLSVAKGLSVAWQVPLIGVHHMQAHALTPRLVSATKLTSRQAGPDFPFLTLLVSGGHSMLIATAGLTHHTMLAQSADIALGDCLDKAARCILPPEKLIMPYGRALEEFAFPDGEASYDYEPPRNREAEIERRVARWGWSIDPPLAKSRHGRAAKRMEFSFSGLLSAVERIMRHQVNPTTGTVGPATRDASDVSIDERKYLARMVQVLAFEHLAGRVLLHLASLPAAEQAKVTTLVVSGGVAANQFLKRVLRGMFDVRGYKHVQLHFPPIELCTDNAAMIAWAGCEMWEAGFRSSLDIAPIKKWSMDPSAEDGGILGPSGWITES